MVLETRNERNIYSDVKYGFSVRQIFDTATRFSTATFIDSFGETYGKSVEGVFLAFVTNGCTIYTGYPNGLEHIKDPYLCLNVENN